SIVWIDGGLHATEVLGAAQLIETIYQFASKTDPETMRILDDCIILAAHANPDGMELVSNWYMKDADTLKRSMNIPRLYQKYIGHDDNRDFYISNQPETQNINHQLYWEWFPQIVYNHHQTGPAGTVMFAPPFRDPFNFNFDPLVPVELDLVAASMHSRFEAEGKAGVTMRSGSSYSTWWNGGLRTMVYFHNMIGLLTETIGNPTPQTIPFIPAQNAGGPVGDPIFAFGRGADPALYTKIFRDPAKRDPRGYVVPSDQADFLTATKFINTLRHAGVTVLRTTTPFTVAGKSYPAN